MLLYNITHPASHVTSQCLTATYSYGIFRIAAGLQIALYHSFTTATGTPSSQSQMFRFAHYNSFLSGINHHVVFAEIHAAGPIDNDILPQNSTVYLVGTIFVQTGPGYQPSMIDAVHLHTVGRDPTTAGYQHPILDVPASYIKAVGTVSCQHHVLPNGSKVFLIAVSQSIRNGMKSFHIVYVPASSFLHG